MFNLPPSIFNYQAMGDREPQSKWSTTNPFRTVEVPGAYGDGLNSSAAQLYSHMLRFKDNDYMKDRGFRPAHKMQSIEDFMNRRNPVAAQLPQINVQPPKEPGNVPSHLPVSPGGWPSIFKMPQSMPAPMPGNPSSGQFPSVQMGQPQQMNSPMVPMPNMNAGIFNMPQFNRR